MTLAHCKKTYCFTLEESIKGIRDKNLVWQTSNYFRNFQTQRMVKIFCGLTLPLPLHHSQTLSFSLNGSWFLHSSIIISVGVVAWRAYVFAMMWWPYIISLSKLVEISITITYLPVFSFWLWIRDKSLLVITHFSWLGMIAIHYSLLPIIFMFLSPSRNNRLNIGSLAVTCNLSLDRFFQLVFFKSTQPVCMVG